MVNFFNRSNPKVKVTNQKKGPAQEIYVIAKVKVFEDRQTKQQREVELDSSITGGIQRKRNQGHLVNRISNYPHSFGKNQQRVLKQIKYLGNGSYIQRKTCIELTKFIYQLFLSLTSS